MMRRERSDHVKDIVDNTQLFKPFLFGRYGKRDENSLAIAIESQPRSPKYNWEDVKKLAKTGGIPWEELVESIIAEHGVVTKGV